MTKTPGKFPDGFLWGASTASHQVEGGTINQWSEWELGHAAELAKTAEARLGKLPIWPEIKNQATDPNNYVSGAGVDHYRRYEEDFDLARGMGLNAFRFGIEWSRIEPEAGKWDEAEVEHYRHYISAMKDRGLEPFLNIWHWTMPTWFTEAGGFAKRSNLKHFDRLVDKLGAEYGHDLRYVLTLNEPNVYASHSYAIGEWVPEEHNPLKFCLVYWNLVKAHRRAYRILKRHNPSLQIGIAQNMSASRPKRPGNYLDRLVARVADYASNYWFVNRIRRQQDFVGFNFYNTKYYRGFKQADPAAPVNDLGWYMEPSGVYDVIMQCHRRYGKPIFIAENGVADARDKHRAWWLEETAAAMGRAIEDGADLRGYMHWSLLDNFEWKYGWWPKFGLIEVDRENGMRRTVRPSAKALVDLIKKAVNRAG
jgi:beta-glucosidase